VSTDNASPRVRHAPKERAAARINRRATPRVRLHIFHIKPHHQKRHHLLDHTYFKLQRKKPSLELFMSKPRIRHTPKPSLRNSLRRIFQLQFVFDNNGFSSRVDLDFLRKHLGTIRKIPIEPEDLNRMTLQ
jgi:hypothetical protein